MNVNLQKLNLSTFLLFSSITAAHAGAYVGAGGGFAEYNSDLFGYEFGSTHGIFTGEMGYLWHTDSKTPWFIGPALNATYYLSEAEEEDDDEYDDDFYDDFDDEDEESSHLVLLRADVVGGKYLTENLSAHARLGVITDQYFSGGAPAAGVGIGYHVTEAIKVVPEAIIMGTGWSSITNYTLMLQYHF